jgi:hypothetical protein
LVTLVLVQHPPAGVQEPDDEPEDQCQETNLSFASLRLCSCYLPFAVALLTNPLETLVEIG